MVWVIPEARVVDRLRAQLKIEAADNDEYTAPKAIWTAIQEIVGTGNAILADWHFKTKLFPLVTNIALPPNLRVFVVWNRSTTQTVFAHFEVLAHDPFDILLAPNSFPLVISGNPQIGAHPVTSCLIAHIMGAAADVDVFWSVMP